MNKNRSLSSSSNRLDRSNMGDDSTPEQSPVLGNPRKRKRLDPVCTILILSNNKNKITNLISICCAV